MQNAQYKKTLVVQRELAGKNTGIPFFQSQIPAEEISHGRYTVRFARTAREVAGALNLQYRVFNLELKNDFIAPIFDQVEEDLLPTNCLYLIVLEKDTEQVIGTYRLSTLETVKSPENFFSAGEFRLNDLPHEILARSIEISRLCISGEHRNKQVLFLLWKCLANHLMRTNKRYVFGCCSIFSQDYREAVGAFQKLEQGGYLHTQLRVAPSAECLFTPEEKLSRGFSGEFILPKLFGSYLKLGAKICSEPAIDRDFKTVDFFMLFDVREMNGKYFRMFFKQ